jgi:excisionase family DNA binding protein
VEAALTPLTGLSIRQAAEFLNVSEPGMVQLLDNGLIPSSGAGADRRVSTTVLAEYRTEDDRDRVEAADELTKLTPELGLG